MNKLLLIALFAVILMIASAAAQSYDYEDYEDYENDGLQLALTDIQYKVVSGDCLSVIAQRFGTTVAAIKSLNGLKSDTIYVGQILRIPGGSPTPPTPSPSPSDDSAASKYDMSINYQQCNAAWKNTPIASGGTICSIGCLITSITNSIYARGKKIGGQTARPDLFVAKAQFTSGGAFYHGSVSNVCAGCSYVDSCGQASFAQLKSWFNSDYTVVVSIRNWGHYLSVWKATSSAIYVRDPAGQASTLTYAQVTGYKLYKI